MKLRRRTEDFLDTWYTLRRVPHVPVITTIDNLDEDYCIIEQFYMDSIGYGINADVLPFFFLREIR